MADDASVACTVCAREWTALRRRHHCRRCGRLVCAGCSQSRLALDGLADRQRVCDRCSPESATFTRLCT
jgi:hypothetical protein